MVDVPVGVFDEVTEGVFDGVVVPVGVTDEVTEGVLDVVLVPEGVTVFVFDGDGACATAKYATERINTTTTERRITNNFLHAKKNKLMSICHPSNSSKYNKKFCISLEKKPYFYF